MDSVDSVENSTENNQRVGMARASRESLERNQVQRLEKQEGGREREETMIMSHLHYNCCPEHLAWNKLKTAKQE